MMYPPPPPKRNGKMIAVVILSVIVVVASIAVIATVVLPTLGITAPNPKITMKNGHDGLSGLNYVYYIDATIKNEGADGMVTVYGEINGGGRYEQKENSVY